MVEVVRRVRDLARVDDAQAVCDSNIYRLKLAARMRNLNPTANWQIQ